MQKTIIRTRDTHAYRKLALVSSTLSLHTHIHTHSLSLSDLMFSIDRHQFHTASSRVIAPSKSLAEHARNNCTSQVKRACVYAIVRSV